MSPLQISGNKRDSSADIRSCVRRLCDAASSKAKQTSQSEVSLDFRITIGVRSIDASRSKFLMMFAIISHARVIFFSLY